MKKNRIAVAILMLTLFLAFSTLVPTTSADETVTNTQMLNYCGDCDSYIDLYGSVPNSVGPQITAAEFYYMMARWLRYYKNYSAAPATVSIIRGTQGPASPSGVETANQIQKADLLTKGQTNADFIDTNGLLPNYSTVSSTQYTTKAMFWVFVRTMRWYRDNGSMPTYATVKAVNPPSSWTDAGAPTPTSTPNPYPWSKTLDLGYTAQPDSYTCGPTSLRMCMGYYGVWYSVTTIGNYMASIGDSPWYDGVARETIRSAAQHYGFSGAHLSTGLANLKTCITNNWPVIGHIQIIGGSYPRYYPSNETAYSGSYGHYVAICGLQADGNGNVLYFVVNDPARGQYVKYTYSSFMSAWGDKSYYYVNIHS